MRDPRLILIVGAAPLGMVIGAATWLMVGGATPATRRLADLEVNLGQAPAASPLRRAPSGAQAAFLAPRPLFLTETASATSSARTPARPPKAQSPQMILAER